MTASSPAGISTQQEHRKQPAATRAPSSCLSVPPYPSDCTCTQPASQPTARTSGRLRMPDSTVSRASSTNLPCKSTEMTGMVPAFLQRARRRRHQYEWPDSSMQRSAQRIGHFDYSHSLADAAGSLAPLIVVLLAVLVALRCSSNRVQKNNVDDAIGRRYVAQWQGHIRTHGMNAHAPPGTDVPTRSRRSSAEARSPRACAAAANSKHRR